LTSTLLRLFGAKAQIKVTFIQIIVRARIWLFGSRVDDHKRGGDIDLLIETEETDVRRIVKTELAFMVKLQM